MYCSVCNRDTAPISVSGAEYCSVCGTRFEARAAKDAAPSPSPAPKAVGDTPRRVTDLSPRRHPRPVVRAATRHEGASEPKPATPSQPTAKPSQVAPSAAPHHAPAKAATAMHSRLKPAGSRVLDLRPESAAGQATTQGPAAAIKQSPNHIPAATPKSTARERHLAQLNNRLDQAKQYSRSQHISRFGSISDEPAAAPTSAATAAPAPASASDLVRAQSEATPAHPYNAPELPRLAATHHEAMARLAATAPVQTTADHPGTKATRQPRLKLTPHQSRAMATATAVMLMAGYIWLENYPKLALQAASGRAGLTATLPGYVPSSYNLAHTDTSPGLVTLNFTSPSANEALRIAQHRTSWDSSSLLDNYVAQHADDYATVQGQGLTIYLWGNNQAAWVNHGVWYSIEGATRLSREQILKIAYSL